MSHAFLQRTRLGPWPTLALLVAACSSRTTNLASSPRLVDAAVSRDAASMPPREASADAQTDIPRDDAGFTLCGDHRCACSNGKDDEPDGLSDGFDPECTGPYDDDEASFATGVHGEDRDPRCQDCYFDGNSGPGDDGCRVASSCGLDGTPDSASGSCGTCEPSALCINRCLPRTPNGCDCFGCCDVPTADGTVSIRLSDTCSLADLPDATKCPRCLPQPSCKNECGRCELCPGQPQDLLPADCGEYSCDGAARCGPSLPCAGDGYCLLGCCVPAVI